MLYVIVLSVCFFSSLIGVICGIGGGIIIKPVLDAFGMMSVDTINFLSGCTVLSMSSYSIVRNRFAEENYIDRRNGTTLALGAAFGGLAGKEIFSMMTKSFLNNQIGIVQSTCLIILTTVTLIYTINKNKIKTKNIKVISICFSIGMILGVLSSFLGIGGGPINVVVLYYFFSMSSKKAAQNSLYIIFFSQITSLFKTILDSSIPAFKPSLLFGMITCGILGSVFGRKINEKINEKMVHNLFFALNILIIMINIYNFFKYLRLY